MGDDESRRGRGLVDLAALDAHEAVLDDVDPADAVLAGQRIEVLDEFQWRLGDAVDRHRHAPIEGDDDLGGRFHIRRILGVLVQVLDGRGPRILEEPGLQRAAPDVLVDRVRALLRLLNRQVVLLRVHDRLVAGQREVAHGRDARELRREGGNRRLEPHLVVALAGAAVRDAVRP